MSTKSLKEALGRREQAESPSPGAADIRSVKLVLAADRIARPVAFAHFLFDRGMSLRKAHNVLGSISAGRTVTVELLGDPDTIVAELVDLGVSATPI